MVPLIKLHISVFVNSIDIMLLLNQGLLRFATHSRLPVDIFVKLLATRKNREGDKYARCKKENCFSAFHGKLFFSYKRFPLSLTIEYAVLAQCVTSFL